MCAWPSAGVAFACVRRCAFLRARQFFARVFPKGKSCMELVLQKFGDGRFVTIPLPCRFDKRAVSQTSNSSTMNQFNFSDCRKAVNQATFRPTAERKAAAAKLLQEAMDFITNLEEVKETKPKAKRRRKTTKRTPSQKVADAQDRAALKTNEVGPIKPKSAKPKASVKAAAKAAQAVSKHTGAAAKAAKKAELKQAESVPQPKVDDSRLTSLEEKIEMLTQLVALQMQGEPTHSIDAVSIEELPFQL